MPQPTAAEREDRADILALINAYFHLLDTRQFERFDEVFLEDGVYIVHLSDGSVHSFGNLAEAVAGMRFAAQLKANLHGMRNWSITLDGDRAEGLVFAVDDAIDERGGTPELIRHGVRYADRYVRTAAGWRIAHRRMHALWKQVIGPIEVIPEFPAHQGAGEG